MPHKTAIRPWEEDSSQYWFPRSLPIDGTDSADH